MRNLIAVQYELGNYGQLLCGVGSFYQQSLYRYSVKSIEDCDMVEILKLLSYLNCVLPPLYVIFMRVLMYLNVITFIMMDIDSFYEFLWHFYSFYHIFFNLLVILRLIIFMFAFRSCIDILQIIYSVPAILYMYTCI